MRAANSLDLACSASCTCAEVLEKSFEAGSVIEVLAYL